jgi:hypothetical protein
MENSKKWIKIDGLNYAFEVDGKPIGTLEINYTNFDRKALFIIENQKFALKYNGFWKSNFEIKDENDVVIMKSFTEKWYASSTILEYRGKQLKLKIRNNPLAEYVIFDGEDEILAYGLDTNSGKAVVRINSNTSDYLLDYLLSYVFVPIAQENMGDNFVFHTLLMNQ